MLSIRKKDYQNTSILKEGGILLFSICGDNEQKHNNSQSKKNRNYLDQQINSIIKEFGNNSTKIEVVFFLTHPDNRYNDFTKEALLDKKILINYEAQAKKWVEINQGSIDKLKDKKFKVRCILSSKIEESNEFKESYSALENQYMNFGKDKSSYFYCVDKSSKAKAGEKTRKDISNLGNNVDNKIKEKIRQSNMSKAHEYVKVETAALLAMSLGKKLGNSKLYIIYYGEKLNLAMQWSLVNFNKLSLSFYNEKFECPVHIHMDEQKKEKNNNLSLIAKEIISTKSIVSLIKNSVKENANKANENANKANENANKANDNSSNINLVLHEVNFLKEEIRRLKVERRETIKVDSAYDSSKYKPKKATAFNMFREIFYTCSWPSDLCGNDNYSSDFQPTIN